ncbi:MAG TPA: hypothetical protein VMV18_06090, partial [bacterium]|nr:hypothetical protein [bacterium]
RLLVFRSVWFYAPPAALSRALDDKALDAFTENRGLFVAHTYLSASLLTTKSDAHKADLVVKKNAKTGALEIDEKLDGALARLETREKAGALLTIPWRDAGDRLVALSHVEIEWRADGAAVLRNHGTADLAALTVAVPGDVEIAVEGATASPVRHEPGRTTVWFDVPAGAAGIVVRATRGGVPVPLLGARRVTLVPR